MGRRRKAKAAPARANAKAGKAAPAKAPAVARPVPAKVSGAKAPAKPGPIAALSNTNPGAAPASRPVRPVKPEPAQKKKPQAKPRPRPVSYKNVDDDAFFRSLDEKGGRPSGGPSIKTYDAEEDTPVTLEDLFGGDDKR